jgi:hypothetical protein
MSSIIVCAYIIHNDHSLLNHHTHTAPLRVRQPNYKKLKQKAASKGVSLFQLAGADVYSCAKKLEGVATLLTLPLPPELDAQKDSLSAEELKAAFEAMVAEAKADEMASPPYFICNVMMPNYAPSMWGKKDGAGFNITMHFTCMGAHRRALLQELKENDREDTGAIGLMNRFLSCEDFKDALMGRLKGIPFIRNPADLQVGSILKKLMKQYNAKPFLTGPTCHRFVRGELFLECDVDIHIYSYVVRRSAAQLLQTIKDMEVDFALVIESRGKYACVYANVN